MSKQKTTHWFSGYVKPVRKGLYQQLCGFSREVGYQYWNGEFWGVWSESKAEALKDRDSRAYHQNTKWRGLTSTAKDKT